MEKKVNIPGVAISVACRFRRLLSVVVVTSAFVTTTVLVPAQRTSALSQNNEVESGEVMVLRLENKWLDALNTANVNVIAEILADDFVRPAPVLAIS